MNDLWKDSVIEPQVQVPKQAMSLFQVYEDTRIKEDTLKLEHTPQKVSIKTPFSERKHFPDNESQNFTPGSQFAQQIFSDEENHQLMVQNRGTFSTPQKTPNQYFVRQDMTPQQHMTPTNYAIPQTKMTVNIVNQGSITPKPFLSQPLPQTPRERQRNLSQPTEFVHPTEQKKPAELDHLFDDVPPSANLNESNCNTQVFNFNLHVASTPFNRKKFVAQQYANEMKNEEHENIKLSKQRLFEEKQEEEGAGTEKWYPNQQNQDKLSVILESTKELCYSSGSSSGGTTLKTTTFNGYSLKTIPENISMERNSQNSQTQSKIYVQNPQQINHSHLSQDQSYRMNTQNETLNLPGMKSQRTPSPQKNLTQSYMGMSIPYNQTTNSQARINCSSGIAREEQLSTQMKRPQIPNDQSYIYIAEDTNISNNGESPSKMQFTDLNSPYQSQQYSVKQREQRKLERERFEGKNQEGIFYEGSNDSNSLKDLWGRSPAKGSRMDVDVISQNSNSELRMDYDSCPEPPVDESILLRTPSDPFSSKVTKALLLKVGFPQPRHSHRYVNLQKFPRLITKETVTLGDER